jgi:hypothetical protein
VVFRNDDDSLPIQGSLVDETLFELVKLQVIEVTVIPFVASSLDHIVAGKPYIKNASYGTFASRTFDELFGKNMGVSLWRHVHTNQRVDYNKESTQELKRNARLMGHSLQQQIGTYRYVNGV